jgi:hypothetical protein
LCALAQKLGRPERWDLCFDDNESGSIDASDFAFFAAFFAAACTRF